jgi:hypothetical protein
MSDLEIGPRVHALAEKIAEDALSDEDKAFRLDCFKALSQFFIGMTRISGKKDENDEGVGMSMTDMRANIAAAGNGAESALVRSARRRAGESRDRDRNGKFE